MFLEGQKKFLRYLSVIDRSKQTIIGYGKDLKTFSSFLGGYYNLAELRLVNIKPTDIEEYLYWLKESRGYAPSSRARSLYTLRSFFSWAYQKELVPKNVALSVCSIKLRQTERVYLSEAEMANLIAAINKPLLKVVVITLYHTGLRISECLNLSVSDVDFSRKVIQVKAGKGNKDRTIPMSDRLVAELEKYLLSIRPQSNSVRFFATKKTGKVSPAYVNYTIAQAVKKLNWSKHVTCHTIRHTTASQLVKKGVNLVHIQKLLGHSSLRVTGIYLHTNIEELSESVNLL